MMSSKHITQPIQKISLLVGLIYLIPVMQIQADETLLADEIKASVSDHTYQGSMTDAGFVEYYQSDGTIKGEGYSGKWRVLDDTMCFQYGDKPENCWKVAIEGPAMTMYKDGNVDGNGMLIKGNPNDF